MHLRDFTRSLAVLAAVSVSSLLGACGGSAGGPDTGDRAEEAAYAAATATQRIYDDALVDGWTDASWATRNLANGSPVASGSRSISVTYGPSTALHFHSTAGATTAGFDAVEFRVNGGSNRNPAIRMAVRVAEVERPAVRLSDYCGRIPRNGWKLCRVPLSALQAAGETLSGVVLQENAGVSLAPMYFDAISLVSTQPVQSTVAVAVSPASAALTTGGAQAFTATVTGTTNTAVTWSVQEGAAGGAVDASGSYTAPAAAGTYHVVATSQADTTRTATATVTVTAPPSSPPPPSSTPALAVYDDALAAGWTDSSWATRNLANPSPVASGTSSVSVTFGPWTALHFHSTAGASTSGLDTLALRVNGGTNANPQIRVAVRVAEVERPAVSLSAYCGTIPTNAWTLCQVPLSALQATAETLSGIVIQENAGLSLAPMFLDTISLVSSGQSSPPPPTQTVAVAVSPTSATLTTGGAQAFTATVTGSTNTAVTWSVQEGAAGGTVDAAGRYTAPATAGTYHVLAKSQADATKTASATVTVTAPPAPPPSSPPPATASCGSEPLRTTGTTYYFCDCQAGAAAGCTAGDDARTATQAQNPSTPWRSATKARSIFATMQAGDTVALCRGGKFSYSGGSAYDLWRNRNCTAGSTCDFRDYGAPWGTGSEPRPVVQITDGGHFFYGVHSGGANAGDAVQGYRFMNIELRAGPAYNGYAFNPAHYMSDLTVCNMVMDGFDIGIYQDGLVQRATYRGNRILNNAGDGILAEGDTLVIDGNYFDNNGHNVTGGNQFQHTIYLGGASSKNIRVTNNEIHRSTMSGGSSGTGTCSGTMFVAHGGIDGLVIENNLLDAPNGGCWGLSLTGGGFPGYCYFRNTVIRRNRIQNVGNMSLGVENCPNCVIEDNVIVGGPDPSGITVPTSACTCTGGCDKTTGVVVRNNTIWFPGSVSGIAAINVKTEGTGHVVTSNAIRVASGSGISCLNLPLPASSYSQVNNNVCYGASSWELSKGSLDAWRAATGFDAASKQVDPGFVNPPSDFTPATTSPLLGAASPTQFSPSAVGSVSWSPGDGGKTRDSSPDAGAFER